MHELSVLLGLPAAILVVAGAIVSISVWLEKVSSRDAKADLARYIRSTDFAIRSIRLPAVIEHLFEKIFGTRHLSIKCVTRSVFVSLSAILVSLAIGFLTHYSYFQTMPAVIIAKPGFRVLYFGFITFSLFLDYFNLYKTRLIIRFASTRKHPLVVFPFILLLDFFVSYVIFASIYFLFDCFNMSFQLLGFSAIGYTEFFSTALWIFKVNVVSDVLVHWRVLPHVLAGPFATEVSVLFYSGLLPSIWLWLHVSSLLLMTILIQSSGLIRWSVYFLDVDNHPIRSLGVFTAAATSATWIVIVIIKAIIWA